MKELVFGNIFGTVLRRLLRKTAERSMWRITGAAQEHSSASDGKG